MQSADLLLMVANCQQLKSTDIQQFITPGRRAKRKALDLPPSMKMTFSARTGVLEARSTMREEVPPENKREPTLSQNSPH